MLTRESLVYATATINGEKALRQIVDHDPCSIPLGKARAAEVVDIGKTAALLVIPDETHRVATSIHEPSGIPIVEITYSHDNRPFVLHPAGETDAGIAVEVDPANFDSFEDIKAFQDLAEQNGANEKTSLMGRRSLTPEPLIQFLISDPVLASVLIWALRRGERFLTYTVDATARKAGEAISDTISARLRSRLENFNRHRSQDDRAVTSEIIVNVDPQIILITTGQHTEQQTDIGIQSLTKHLELWEPLLHKADSITFVRESKNEEWIFLHMTTSDGKVIAAEDSYLRTITRREEITRTKPLCVCLKHKVTGEERHHETTAVFTKVDEAGRFEVRATVSNHCICWGGKTMPIISQADATTEVGYPGVERAVLVDATQGALSLYISHLEIGPGGRVTTHIHPDSEEAMVIVEGSLEAILGDQVVTLGEGDTVLAPAGVKHGFENRSGATARLLAIFPKTQFERVPME